MLRNILIPVGVVVVLSSMLLPLPSFVVDFLLVGNLVLALLLLGSALYLEEPTKLSALPTILLLATLYRLALNVSTTRLILGNGHAGAMIETFGELLMNGNLVVGVVVFCVITFVQFIVIAKGAERVAEVSARFTLDALPGKQMSIDSDMRAGLIDLETARRKREDLQVESRFYGALDGAMKFVKGDAIAGIAITCINIVGGLAIGVAVLGLDVSHALSQFTLLTVGDGLLSQVPALLNSLAAGMIITRVTREGTGSIADEMVHQIVALKPALFLAGTVSLLFALVPGTPWYFFLSLGSFLFVVFFSPSLNQTSEENEAPSRFEPRTPPVLEFVVPTDSLPLFPSKKVVSSEIHRFLSEIHSRTGLFLMPPEFRISSDLRRTVEILFRGVKVMEFSPDHAAKTETFFQDSLAQVLLFVLTNRKEFIDDVSTRRLLDNLERTAPELVASVVPTVVSVTQLSTLLRALAEEDVSFVNIDQILQSISEIGVSSTEPRTLLEQVRVGLRRTISAMVKGKEIDFIRLHPLVDFTFAECERTGGSLPPELIQELERCFEELVDERKGWGVICSSKARRLIHDFLLASHAKAEVFADEELTEEVLPSSLEVIPASYSFDQEALAA